MLLELPPPPPPQLLPLLLLSSLLLSVVHLGGMRYRHHCRCRCDYHCWQRRYTVWTSGAAVVDVAAGVVAPRKAFLPGQGRVVLLECAAVEH